MSKVIAKPGGTVRFDAFDLATKSEIFNARRATAIAIAAVLFLIALAWHSQCHLIKARENERAENLARAFEFHVHHEIQNIDDLLRQLRTMVLETDAGFREAVAEIRAGEMGQRAIHFSLIGTDGYLRHRTDLNGDLSQAFLGDLPLVSAHQD